jgi:hypothetical protein
MTEKARRDAAAKAAEYAMSIYAASGMTEKEKRDAAAKFMAGVYSDFASAPARERGRAAPPQVKAPIEFSKKVLYAAAIMTFLIVIFTMYMIWATKDLSPLQYLIPAAFAESATGTGFYYWKAKAENKLKLEKEYGIKPKSEDV